MLCNNIGWWVGGRWLYRYVCIFQAFENFNYDVELDEYCPRYGIVEKAHCHPRKLAKSRDNEAVICMFCCFRKSGF